MKLTREQLAQRTAKEKYQVKRLAEKVAGSGILYRPEAQALTFIADAQTMRDGLCDKALARCDEKGYSRKQVQCGLHGYTRKGKREYIGLLDRHIVYIVGKQSKGGLRPGGYGAITTAYAIDVDVLLTYVSDVPPEPNLEANPSANISANMEANPSANVSANLAPAPTSSCSSLNSPSLKSEKREREEVKLPAAAQPASAGSTPTAKPSPSLSAPAGKKPAQRKNINISTAEQIATSVVDWIIGRAKELTDGKAQFSQKSKCELLPAAVLKLGIQSCTPNGNPADADGYDKYAIEKYFEKAIRLKAATRKDSASWDMFGSQLASDLVQTIETEHRRVLARKQLGRCTELWTEYRKAFEAAVQNLENLDVWVKEHPEPDFNEWMPDCIHADWRKSLLDDDASLIQEAKQKQDAIRAKRQPVAAPVVKPQAATDSAESRAERELMRYLVTHGRGISQVIPKGETFQDSDLMRCSECGQKVKQFVGYGKPPVRVERCIKCALEFEIEHEKQNSLVGAAPPAAQEQS